MNSIKKNFLYNAFYQVLVLIIPLITTPYISRVLGAEGIGIYSYSYSIAQYYVLFIMLGLNNYGNRTVAIVKHNKDALSKNFWSIYVMQIGIGIIIVGVYLGYVIYFSKNRIAGLIMCLYVISACFDINWFFFGMEQFKITIIRNSIIKILTTVLIFIFVKSPEDVYNYCILMVMGMLINQLALWPYAKKVILYYKPKWAEIKVHIKPNLLLFLTVIAVSMFKIMDKIMLGLIANTEQVGFYESSERVISIPTAFVTALGTVMLPRISSMVKENNNDLNNLIYKSILFAMFLSSSMSFGIMAVSPTFVPLFYGPGYDICISLFLILLPSCLFFAFGNVIRTQYLLPHKLDKIYVISAFLGAFVNIIINLVLIPKLEAIGAAIGTLFAEMIVCIYQAFMIRKYIHIRKFVKHSVPFLLSGIWMFFIVYNLNFNIKNNILRLLLEIFIGMLVYSIALFLQYIVINKILHCQWLKEIF